VLENPYFLPFPSPEWSPCNPKKECHECNLKNNLPQKGKKCAQGDEVSHNGIKNDTKCKENSHNDNNLEPGAVLPSPEKVFWIRVFPYFNNKALFKCDCGEISGFLPQEVVPLWLKLSKSDIRD